MNYTEHYLRNTWSFNYSCYTLMVIFLSLGLISDGFAAAGCPKYSKTVNLAIAAFTTSERGLEYCEYRQTVSGDVDKDGQLDLIVGFTVEGSCADDPQESPGTCGNNYETYLMVFTGTNQVPTTPLMVGGKFVQSVEKLSITAGLIQVDGLKFAQDDASCCPSLPSRELYRLEGRTLVAATPGAQQAPPSASANQHTDTKASSLVVEGTLVNYQPVPEVRPNTVAFQTETKGYRNIYLLDCQDRKYYWAKNIELRTQQETTNTAGAEWKMMSEKSTISNAVYQASCPQLLGSKPAESDPSASENPQFELEFWSSVKNSDDLADFQAYLDKYPQGQFEALARRRIDRLKEAVPVKPTAISVQDKPKPRTFEGTITSYECGDNCYLTITDLQGQEQTGLCGASICELWGENESSFSRYQGKKVRITVDNGQRVDGEGEVIDEMDAYVKIEAL